MESLSIPVGYGVEFATLMDTAAGYGLDAVAQVDLGSRAHRHQANHDLALMAAELLLVAERRSPAGPPRAASAGLHQFVRDAGGRAQPVTRPVPVHERPPVASLAERPPVASLAERTPVASLAERPPVTPGRERRAATGGADEVSLIVGGFPPTGGRKSASYRTAAGGAEGEGGAEGAGGAGD
jgi:hypothetical protein